MVNSTKTEGPSTGVAGRERPVRWLGIAAGIVLLWFAAAEAVTFCWYASHESKLPKNQLPATGGVVIDGLKKRVEDAGGKFKEQGIGDAAMEILKCSYGKTLIWATDYGAPMALTVLRWDDRSIVGGLETMHNPGNCLQAAGWQIGKKTEFGVEDFCGASSEVTQWEVSQGGQRMMAYSAVFRRFAGEAAGKSQVSFWNNERLQPVLSGRRDAPVFILLAYLPVDDFGDSTAGHERFQKIMQGIFCDAKNPS